MKRRHRSTLALPKPAAPKFRLDLGAVPLGRVKDVGIGGLVVLTFSLVWLFGNNAGLGWFTLGIILAGTVTWLWRLPVNGGGRP